jgi:Domain of unknown function (DUF4062)
MSTKWQTARVFISSTFRDMHAERDHLIKVMLPELRERLAPYRVELIDIDLRMIEAIHGSLEGHGWMPKALNLVDAFHARLLPLLPERLVQNRANLEGQMAVGSVPDDTIPRF